MIYEEFIRCLKRLETTQIKVLSFPSSCTLTQLPEAFHTIFPELINILQNNFAEFCQQDEVMGLFSLQAAAGRIESPLPQQYNRIYFLEQPDCHFCCVLNYLILSAEKITKINDWKNYHSIVVDFTSGDIMTIEHYLFLTANYPAEGKVYGQLNAELLEKTWQIAQLDFKRAPYEKKCINR